MATKTSEKCWRCFGKGTVEVVDYDEDIFRELVETTAKRLDLTVEDIHDLLAIVFNHYSPVNNYRFILDMKHFLFERELIPHLKRVATRGQVKPTYD